MVPALNDRMREKLLPMVRTLVERFHPRKIILFGSQAAGGARPDSDADLVVLADSDVPPLHLAAEMSAAVDHSVPLDIVVFRPADWEASIRRGGVFATLVNRDGIILHEA